jgi:hypothetical protein
MTPSEVAYKLKQIHKRKFRSDEMSEYAKKLGLKTTNGKSGGNLTYIWDESDFEKLNYLIN